MQEINLNNLLKEEIEKYYSDKKYDMKKVSDCIYNSIVAGIDCDFAKLVEALKNMAKNRHSLFDMQNVQVFDISSKTSKVAVKQVCDDIQEPILLFFKDDETLPFFKVISYFDKGTKNISVETSNNPVMLSKIKEKIDTTGYNYIFKDNYFFKENNNVLATKSIFTKSGLNIEELQNSDIQLSDDENLFFAFLSKKLDQKYDKTPKSLSFEQFQMIKYFCNTMSDVFSYECEFAFGDLVKILSAVCLDNKNLNYESGGLNANGLSFVAENIVQNLYSGGNFEYQTINNAGDNLTIRGLASAKYCSIDFFNDIGKRLCNYMFYETDKGFTLFRSLKKSEKENKSILDLCTLNLTDNILKFSAMGDVTKLSDKVSPIDIQLKFKKSGEFLLSGTLVAELKNKELIFVPSEKINI